MEMAGVSVDWLQAQLAKLLEFNDTEDLAKYVASIESPQERESYLREMLDPGKSRAFFDDLKQREETQSGVAYRKPNFKDSKAEKASSPSEKSTEHCQESAGKKKSKFVALYSSEGQAKEVVTLKGRHPCSCMASKHTLINNCTECGKIVCSQEGSGPCLFCGALVCSKEENEILKRNSRKSEVLRKKLMSVSNGEADASNKQDDGYSRAERHKNVLLEYDRTSEQRTKVIDDESDYFSVDSNQWLSPSQRLSLAKRKEELAQQKHASRLDKKYIFDFAGRQIIEAQDGLSNYNPEEDKILKEVLQGKKSDVVISPQEFSTISNMNDGGIANNDVSVRPMLVDDFAYWTKQGVQSQTSSVKPNHRGIRIQDAQLQEMSDDGYCLSMHQPWASYLVAGIKIHEGRTWYTAHRGRLWIHAASKEPTAEEIALIQRETLIHHGVERIPFPTSLPTSCLLGSVDVVDCLGQEEYQTEFPNGESDSPFVFICKNPQELLVKFPMSGNHKIFKLDSNIHKAAQKMAKKSPVV